MRKILLLLLLIYIAGCANPIFEWGKKEMASREYDSAATIFRFLAVEDPEDEEINKWLRKAEKKAAQKHLSMGEMYISSGRLHEAREELRLTLEYDPQNLEAKKKMAQIKAQTELFKKEMKKARALGEKKKFDASLKVLKGLEKLEKTFSEITLFRKYCLTESFHIHLKKGISLFEKRDYTGAEKEIAIAVQRRPDLKEGHAWHEKVKDHLQARDLTKIALKEFAKGKGHYEKSYKTFKKALDLVPDFYPALTGSKKALSHWMDELYAQARKKESFERKSLLHKALDIYFKCQRLLPDHRDIPQRIKLVKTKLARHYFKEGKFFFYRPQLRRIALAYKCFQRAHHYNPHHEGLKVYLQKSRKLLSLRKRQVICVAIQGGSKFAKRVTNGLADYIKKKNYPDVVVRLGSGQEVKEELNQAVAQAGYNPQKNGPILFPTLNIAGEVDRDFAKKTGGNQAIEIISRYVSGRRRVPNPDYYQALFKLNHNKRAKSHAENELKGLKSDYSKILAKKNKAQAEFNRANRKYQRYRREMDGYRQQASRYHSRFQRYKAQLRQERSNQQRYERQARNYENEAERYERMAQRTNDPNRESQYERQARSKKSQARRAERQAQQAERDAESAKRSMERAYSRYKRYHNKGNALVNDVNRWNRERNSRQVQLTKMINWLNSAQNAVNDCSARIAAYTVKIGVYSNKVSNNSKTIRKKVLSSYTFSRYYLQVFGKVKIRTRVIHCQKKKVLQKSKISIVDRKKDIVQTGVKSSDQNDYSNDGDDLPSARSFRERLRKKAFRELTEEIHSYLVNRQERFYYRGKAAWSKSHHLDGLENYLLFLDNPGESDKDLVNDSMEKVQSRIRLSLK